MKKFIASILILCVALLVANIGMTVAFFSGATYLEYNNIQIGLSDKNIEISTDDCMVMGKNQDTVAFMYGGVKYCKFKCSEGDELLIFARGLSDEYVTLNVVGKCSINEYKGSYTPQVIIDDYEFTI